MHKLIFILLLSIFSYANNLVFQKGEIKAHTEIFGDSKIDPLTKEIDSNITIDENIESIKGKISINSLSLKSDNKDRDIHMYDVLNIKIHPKISIDIKNLKKNTEDSTTYIINGLLNLNGITKEIISLVLINKEKNLIALNGDFSIKLSDFNINPPTLLFLEVRDQIDIKYNLLYKKGE